MTFNPQISRRTVFQATAAAAGAATLFDQAVERAAATAPNHRHGDIRDVEHVVILMQENRSFDTYYGAMRGVRGFGDPHPALLDSGRDVWHQSDGTHEVLPFHPEGVDLGKAFVVDLDHSWKLTHEAVNGGRYDKWLQTKTQATMIHYKRADMPWYYALADSFTICDAYHSSLLGMTDPNRYYMWTGWTGNDGVGGGPDLWNGEKGYSWGTYPERLTAAGVRWRIYQDIGAGLTAEQYWGWGSNPYIGNYGDNSLLYFLNYQNAQPGSVLYESARRGTNKAAGDDLFSQLRADVKANKLPPVSWITAPEAYTEHGNWPVDYGMWYVANVLDALTSNPEVWARTALFLVYDENDGFFDHVVPPAPNTPEIPGASTVATDNEFYAGANDIPGNYGLGVRVPAMVISPWTTGGWVCSETFDHTSLIRFLERRFGVTEPNITPWRRAICGDFTSAFDFGRRNTRVPRLPATAGLAPTDELKHPDWIPVPPPVGSMPVQEHGTRPSRALGYRFDVNAVVKHGSLVVDLVNRGRLGVAVQVRSMGVAPMSYTTGAHARQTTAWSASGSYDYQVHGADGFYRRFAGSAATAGLEVVSSDDHGKLVLRLVNRTRKTVRVSVGDAHRRGRGRHVSVPAGRSRQVEVTSVHGWYDVTLTASGGWMRSLAGRVHTGRDGISDPQLG